MQGVEILTSAQVVAETTFPWNTFWVIFGAITFIGLLIGLLCLESCEWTIVPSMLVVGALIGSLIGWAFGTECPDAISYETQYKVTISEEVSMTDFYEHYEVIDQDGKIFTVREKTNE